MQIISLAFYVSWILLGVVSILGLGGPNKRKAVTARYLQALHQSPRFRLQYISQSERFASHQYVPNIRKCHGVTVLIFHKSIITCGFWSSPRRNSSNSLVCTSLDTKRSKTPWLLARSHPVPLPPHATLSGSIHLPLQPKVIVVLEHSSTVYRNSFPMLLSLPLPRELGQCNTDTVLPKEGSAFQ
jgi:hypothetical protein